MNRKTAKILESIFETPTRANIKFSDLEKLMVSPGAEITEGNGSRVSFELNGEKLFVHRPHPAKEAKRYHVEAFREFLERVGVRNG